MANVELQPKPHPAFVRWARWSYGPKIVQNDFWRARLNEDPRLDDAVWCLEAVFGTDGVVRVASRSISTYSAMDGRRFDWKQALGFEPVIPQSYQVGTGQSPSRSINVILPTQALQDHFDPMQIVARGRMLAGFAELSLQYDGQDYDERLVIMRGDMDSGVAFGPGDGGMMMFALTDPRNNSNLNLTPWVIDEERNGTLVAERSVGQRYPAIFNRFVVPAPIIVNLATATKVLVAADHGHTVNSVKVDGETFTSSDAEFGYQTAEELDSFGVPFTSVTFDGYHQFDADETIHVDISAGTPTAKDLLGIIDHLLISYTTLGRAGINAEMFARSQAKIGPSTIRALVNGSGESTAARTVDFIEGELLRSFPMVSMGWEGTGYGPIVTDRRSSLIKAHLVAGQFPLVDRISDVQETPKQSLLNNFTLRYNYDIVGNIYTSVITRHPNNSTLCAISADNIGEAHASPIESVHIFDDAVAEYVIEWMVNHLSMASYYVEYQAFPWVGLNLFRGDNVEITDSDWGWSKVPATIERVDFQRGWVLVGLRVWFDFYRVRAGAVNQGAV